MAKKKAVKKTVETVTGKFNPVEELACPKCGYKGLPKVPKDYNYQLDVVDETSWSVMFCPATAMDDEYARVFWPEHISMSCPRCGHSINRLPLDAEEK